MNRLTALLFTAALTSLGAGPAHAVTREEVLARAQAWVDAGVPYSWSAWYTDPTTGVCCYRSDCSGYVSAVWGIGAPGNTTYSFAGGPWDNGLSYQIDAAELLPGDALNYPGDPNEGTGHIMLYVSGDFWSGWVEVYEEYTHSEPATHHWRSIDPSIYLPIRYVGIEDCTVESCNGADDDCDGSVDESWVCAADDEVTTAAWLGDAAASTDVDGDGRADVCARAAAGLICALSSGAGFASLDVLAALANDHGYTAEDQYTTLHMADVTGDGRADVCARHQTEGFRCWPSTGAGFGAPIFGPEMSDANGWSDESNYATLRMADIDGDGRADLCGRGDMGFYCWRSDGTSITTEVVGPELSDAAGWSDRIYWSTLRMGDVNGDGRDDVCARAADCLYCWLSDGSSFPTRIDGPALSNEGGWSAAMYYSTLALPDINGDGRADVCARGAAVVYCWTSTGTGFSDTILGPPLSNDQGWSEHDQYSTLRWGDINGDGRDDLCARGADGFWCWPANGAGFDGAISGPAMSDSNGWSDYPNYSTLTLGDIDADGLADLCARGDAGLYCWRSQGSSFSDAIPGPEWSDALGWEATMYFGTVRVAGGGPLAVTDTGAPAGGDTEAPDATEDDVDVPRGIRIEANDSGACGCGVGTPMGWFAGLGLLAVGRRRGQRPQLSVAAKSWPS